MINGKNLELKVTTDEKVIPNPFVVISFLEKAIENLKSPIARMESLIDCIKLKKEILWNEYGLRIEDTDIKKFLDAEILLENPDPLVAIDHLEKSIAYHLKMPGARFAAYFSCWGIRVGIMYREHGNGGHPRSWAYKVHEWRFQLIGKMEPKAKTIIERLGFKDVDRKDSVHDQIQIWVFHNFKTVMKSCFPELSELTLSDFTQTPKLEYPIMDKNYIIGFADQYLRGVAIEVKTKIPVVGDLIRQINFYREYLGGATWLVVSPDARYGYT